MSTVPANQYEVIIPELDERRRYHASKILMEWLDMSWSEARDLVSRHPTIVVCGPNADKAQAIRSALAEVSIDATIQEVDAETLRQHLFIAAGMSMAAPPPSPFEVRRAFWWVLALFGVPFLLWQALSWFGLYSTTSPPALLILEIQPEPAVLVVRNLTGSRWQGCTAMINEFFAQRFDDLAPSATVRLPLEEFVGRGAERGVQSYLAAPGQPRAPLLSVTVSCSEPPGSWRRTF